MKKVLILGCGWVAEDLAFKLLESGFHVVVTTTSVEKSKVLLQKGLEAYVVDFDKNIDSNFSVGDFDYVLTSVPAASKNTVEQTKYRFEQIKSFLENTSFRRHIYLSSTGIYPDCDGLFTEYYIKKELNERLSVAEQLMLTLSNSSVYRLGGLFGKNRIFAKYFENRICSTGNQVANFVHVDDVVDLIYKGFEIGLQSDIYNIVAPEHPNKEEVIRASAQKYGFQLPSEFKPENSFQKIVDGSKIINELNYSFKHPSPLEF